MAVKSSALLTYAIENIGLAIGAVSGTTLTTYAAMGVGDNGTAASAGQTTLLGNAIYASVTATGTTSLITWNHQFTYSDIHGTLTDDTIREYCVNRSSTQYGEDDLLVRTVVDDVKLGEGESMT